MKLLLALALTLCATSALATPSLRGDVTVTAAIVTVGDMFDDAGSFSELALFRAPAPGTMGIVPLADVTRAARLIGLSDFENIGLTRVRVARAATLIDADAISRLINAELGARGMLDANSSAQIRFDTPNLAFNAEAVETPALLTNLRYTPANGLFSARLQLAGIDRPIDITGGIEMMIKAPQLITSYPAGTILQASDFELKPVERKYAETYGIAPLDQLIGKQLQRQTQAGMLLRATDVAEPVIVSRSAIVTVYLHSGAMTLTVKGQALNNAAVGQPVAVMNSLTKKILHGIALPSGAVEIASDTLNIAGL